MGLLEQDCQYVWLLKCIISTTKYDHEGWGREVHPTQLCISSEMDTFGLFSYKLPECKLQGFSSANSTQYSYFLFYEEGTLSFYIHFRT